MRTLVLYPADVELVRAVQRGDVGSREEFLQRARCIPRILHLLNRRLPYPLHTQELNDLSQEAFARAWSRLDRFRGHAALEAWLHRFCLNVLRRSLDQRTRGRAIDVKDGDEFLAPGERQGPELDLDPILRSIEALPDPYQSVVRARLLDDASFEAISEALGISVGTVKTRYYRGMEQLRRAVGSVLQGDRQ